ncbi:MAG: hypothetical protein IK136_03090 [Oscillospiraceae bacterium]|nr:hypothetical protein [Oscillospiraceae bacterium]
MTEILITVCVLSLVGAFALPTVWRAGQAVRLEGEAARLAAALMKHREVIMSRQAAHSGFAAASGESAPIFTMTQSEYYVQVGTARKERHQLPAGVSLEAEQKTVTFLVNGGALPITIKLREGGEVRYVIVDVAGRVRVSPDPPHS